MCQGIKISIVPAGGLVCHSNQMLISIEVYNGEVSFSSPRQGFH